VFADVWITTGGRNDVLARCAGEAWHAWDQQTTSYIRAEMIGFANLGDGKLGEIRKHSIDTSTVGRAEWVANASVNTIVILLLYIAMYADISRAIVHLRQSLSATAFSVLFPPCCLYPCATDAVWMCALTSLSCATESSDQAGTNSAVRFTCCL